MKKKLFVLVAMIMISGYFSCNDPVSGSSPVAATEKWQLSAPQTQSEAMIDLQKHENGDISVSGNWRYDFYSNEITCTIMSGSATKDTNHLSFNCSGTASYPPDTNGFTESSPFTLTMDGTFQHGNASGEWAITFSDAEWNEWAPEGVFTGQLESGFGITE